MKRPAHLTALLLMACGSSTGANSTGVEGEGSGLMETTTTTTESQSETQNSEDTSSTDTEKLDLASGGDGDGDCTGEGDALLTGTVHAPNGEVPVSGALVYTTYNPPVGIPQEVYCAECEELDPCVEFVLSAPDGSFSLPADSGEGQYLVVVKGQFMRVTPMDIVPELTTLTTAVTDLPGSNDPDNGIYTPRIALGMSSPDAFEIVLGKVGLADVVNGSVVAGTEDFDVYNNGADPSFAGFTSQGTMASLVADPALLAKYHIIFVPCIGGSGLLEIQSNPSSAQNVRDWVEAGGRIYATDYAEDWIEALFPDYQSFNGEPGAPTPIGMFDTLATVNHPDLLAWLEAMPENLKDVNPLNGGGTLYPTLADLPQVLITDNYTGIELPLPEILVDDGKGGTIDVGHEAWLEGPWPGAGGTYPPAVIGQYGCGRLHFTSYHTAGSVHVGMIPQELIMLYSVLEVGVCQAEVPPID